MTQEIKPTYVTFEQAKWLKEKGFNEACFAYFIENQELIKASWSKDFQLPTNKDLLPDWHSAPEQHQVVEWLRVNHGIHIEILLEENKPWNKFYYRIMKIGQYFSLSHDGIYSETPQEAYSAAFDYVLNNNLI